MPDDTALVSLADVARLAGVTRPAVSNWRRRHKDFPVPVRETDAAALFALADIRTWLTAHGKELTRPSLRDEIAAALNTVRADISVRAVVRNCLQVLTRYVTEGRGEPGAVAKGAEPVVDLLPRLVDIHGEPAVCEALIAEAEVRDGRSRWHVPPRGVVEAVLAFAGDLSGTVHDPHCGTGSLLLAVARSGSDAWLVGDCDGEDERQVAVQRLTIHGVAAEVRKESRDQVGDVVLSAPYDVVRDGESLDRTVRALRAGTRGIHLSPNDLLTHKWDRKRRRRLVREGLVEAVVELPGGLYEGRAPRPALWLLRAPGEATARDVLLVDARNAAVTDGKVDRRDLLDLVRTYRTWQETGDLPEQRFAAIAVRKEKLLAHECWLDVGSWRADVDLPDALARYDRARGKLAETATTLASATALPYEPAASTAPRRTIHELVDAGEAELIHGVPLDAGPDWPTTRRGDVVISTTVGYVEARVVTRGGALLLEPEHCLRLRRPSMARARTIVAQLSAELPSMRYADVRHILLRWPDDEECERVAAALDHLAEVRRQAAEVAEAAEVLTARTLEVLAAGAEPRTVDR